MLKVGTKAVDFALQNQEGKEIRLSDYRGKKVVLYFYSKDNTPGCSMQACGFRDLKSRFADVNAIILGISKDSVSSHQKFIQKYGLSFDLLADTTLEVSKTYEVYGEKKMYGKIVMGMIRSTYIIDEEGVVLAAFPNVKAKENPEAMLTYLRELE